MTLPEIEWLRSVAWDLHKRQCETLDALCIGDYPMAISGALDDLTMIRIFLDSLLPVGGRGAARAEFAGEFRDASTDPPAAIS